MSTDELNALSANQPSDASAPRLRLHHLFAFMAAAAVLLAINGRQPDFSDPRFPLPRFLFTLQQGVNVLFQLLLAVAVTAVGYGVAAYRRGLPFFHQPGHWMLVEGALVAIAMLPVSLATRFSGFKPGTVTFDLPMLVMIAAGLYSLLFLVAGRIALNVYLAMTKCRESWWRNVFIGKAVEPVSFGLGDVAVIVLAILAISADRREQIARDGSHWCGVYLQFALCVLTIASMFLGVATAVLTIMRMP